MSRKTWIKPYKVETYTVDSHAVEGHWRKRIDPSGKGRTMAEVMAENLRLRSIEDERQSRRQALRVEKLEKALTAPRTPIPKPRTPIPKPRKPIPKPRAPKSFPEVIFPKPRVPKRFPEVVFPKPRVPKRFPEVIFPKPMVSQKLSKVEVHTVPPAQRATTVAAARRGWVPKSRKLKVVGRESYPKDPFWQSSKVKKPSPESPDYWGWDVGPPPAKGKMTPTTRSALRAESGYGGTSRVKDSQPRPKTVELKRGKKKVVDNRWWFQKMF